MKLDSKKIQLLMAEKELSIVELAKNCGRSRQRVSVILNSVNVNPKTAGAIAKALKVDVTEIIEQ